MPESCETPCMKVILILNWSVFLIVHVLSKYIKDTKFVGLEISVI